MAEDEVTEGVPDPAPYGRKADGTPKRKPGPARGGGRPGGGAPGRPRPSTARARATDYRPGILGMAQTVALPLSFAAPADAAAVMMHAQPIAEALNELAQERPEVAAMLEKILAVGPYGAVIAATVPLLVQLGHNHGIIPEPMAKQLGAVPKQKLLADLRKRAEQMAAQQHQAGAA